MFVSGLFCKPIFCFVSGCGIRVASMSSVDSMPFPKWCSHIILILHDNRDCHVNPFLLVRFSSRWSYHFSHPQDQLWVLLNGVCFHPSQVVFVFPPFHPYSSRTRISLSSIHLMDVKPLYSSLSMFLSGDSQEDTNGTSSSSFSILFISGGTKSSFVDLTPFLISMPFLTGAPLYHSTSRYLLFRSVQDISKIPVSTLHSFKLFRGCYLIQVS